MSQDIPEQIDQLNQQLVQLYQQGQYKQAINSAIRACDLAHQYLGEEDPVFAISVSNLALLYFQIGKYTLAEPLYRQMLAIRQKNLGDAHPDVASSLNNLAGLYYEIGDYEQAEPLYRQALEILHTALGTAHPDVATTLSNLATLYRAMGDYEQAERLHRQALEIRRTVLGETHPDVSASLSNLAALHYDKGDYVQAESLLQKALEIRRTTLGETHPDVATSLNGLGVLYRDRGDYVQAESLLQKALEIRRTTLGETHPDVATSLHNLAELYHTRGGYAQAEPLYQKALEIRRAVLGETHPDVATSLSNLATLYYEIGDYVQAERLHRQALMIWSTVLGESHPNVAASLNNLGQLYYTMDNYEQAERLYRQALVIWRMALGEVHPNVAASLHNLAALYYAMSNYEQAERLYRQALEIRRIALGETHPDVGTNLDTLGQLYYAMGNYEQAERLYRQALAVRRTALGETHSDVATSLHNLGQLYVATARENEALSLMEQAAAIHDRMIGQVFSIGSERQRMAHLTTLQGYFDGLLSLVLLHSSPAAVQTALDLVLRRKAIGAEVLATQRDAILGGRCPSLAPKLHELTALRMQIAQKTLADPGSEGIQVHQQLLAKWNVQKEQLEADLARQIPEMTLAAKLQTANRQVAAEALPRGAVLIEFVRFDIFDFRAVPARGERQWKPAHYVAFILVADESQNVEMIDLGEADPIDQLIATFIISLTDEAEHLRHMTASRSQSQQASYTSIGRALRVMLFDPLLTVLKGCKRLFLAPDGGLTRLPFEVLPTDDEHYVIDDYRISYLSTGRDVLRFDATFTGQFAPPMVVADPDFDLCQGEDNVVPAPVAVTVLPQQRSRDLTRDTSPFERLPGTRVEGQQIAALLGVQPLLEKAALEAPLKASRSPRILHIATHGFFLPDQQRNPGKEGIGVQTIVGSARGRLERFVEQHGENPLLRSGLALAGANTWNRGGSLPPEAEDGLLTAEDVSGLDLLDTELAVLSACETGLGKVHVGEGVFGLRRAFVLAGAKTLVMSLWKVPDAHTQELMGMFYRYLLEGQPRADALRTAQLAMKEQYTHPFYWGAFICQGYPGPLPQ